MMRISTKKCLKRSNVSMRLVNFNKVPIVLASRHTTTVVVVPRRVPMKRIELKVQLTLAVKTSTPISLQTTSEPLRYLCRASTIRMVTAPTIVAL